MMPSVEIKSEDKNICGNETQTVINQIISRMDATLNDDISLAIKTPTEIKSENVHFYPEKENSGDNSFSSCMKCQALQKKLKVSRGWNRFFKEKLLNYDKLLHIIEKYENEKRNNVKLQLDYDQRSREWENQQEQLITLYHEMQPLRERLKLAEETSAEEKELRLRHQYIEDSFKVTIERLQAKISHMNTIANPVFVENLEKKLGTARSENKKVKCNLEFKKAEVEDLRSYITNKHIQVENLSKKLLWALQLAIKYGTEISRNEENTLEWNILQIQSQKIFRALKAQFDSFCATKRKELKGKRVELACLPKFSAWVVDFDSNCSSTIPENESPVKVVYSEDSKPIASWQIDEEANQLEKLLSDVNVEDVFSNMNQDLNDSLDLNVPKVSSQLDLSNEKKAQPMIKKEVDLNIKLENGKKNEKSSETSRRRRSRRSDSKRGWVISTDSSNVNTRIKTEIPNTNNENSQPIRKKRVSRIRSEVSNSSESCKFSVMDDKSLSSVSSVSMNKSSSKSARLRRSSKSDKETDILNLPDSDNLNIFKSRMNKSLDSSTPIKKKSSNEVGVTPVSVTKKRKVVSLDLALSDSSSDTDDDDDTPLSQIKSSSEKANKRVKRTDRTSSSQLDNLHGESLTTNKNIEEDSESCEDAIQQMLNTFFVPPLGDHMPYSEDTNSSPELGFKSEILTFPTVPSSQVRQNLPKKIVTKRNSKKKFFVPVPPINETSSFVPQRVTRSSYKRQNVLDDSLKSEQLQQPKRSVNSTKKKKCSMSSDGEPSFILPSSPVRRRRRTNSKNSSLSEEIQEDLKKNVPHKTENLPLENSRSQSVLLFDLSASSSNAADMEEHKLNIEKPEEDFEHKGIKENYSKNNVNLANSAERKEASIHEDVEDAVASLGLNLSEDSSHEEVTNSFNDSASALNYICNVTDVLKPISPISSPIEYLTSNKDSLTPKVISGSSITAIRSEQLASNNFKSKELLTIAPPMENKTCDASQLETEKWSSMPCIENKESSTQSEMKEVVSVVPHEKSKEPSSKTTKLTSQELSNNSLMKTESSIAIETAIKSESRTHLIDNNINKTQVSSDNKTETSFDITKEAFQKDLNIKTIKSKTGQMDISKKFQSKLDNLFTEDESSQISISPLTTILKRHNSTSSDFSVVLSESSYEVNSAHDDDACNKSLLKKDNIARESELISDDDENSLIMDINDIIIPLIDSKDSHDNRQLSDSDNETVVSNKNKPMDMIDGERSLKFKLPSLVDNIDVSDHIPSKIAQEKTNPVMETTQSDDNLPLSSMVQPSFYKEREQSSEEIGFQIPNIIFEESTIEETSRNSEAKSYKNNKKHKERNQGEQTKIKKVKTKQSHSENPSILLPQVRSLPAFQHTPVKLNDGEMNSTELQEYFEDILGCQTNSSEWKSLCHKICDKLDNISAPNLLSKLQPLVKILLISVIGCSPFESRDNDFFVPPTIYKLFQIIRIIEHRFNFPSFTLDSLVNLAAHKLILQNQLRPNSLASLTTWVICSCNAQYNKLEIPKDEECLRMGRGFLIDMLFHHKGLIHESLLAAVNSSRKIFIRMVRYRESTVVEKLICWIAHHGSWKGPKATKTKLIEALKFKVGLQSPPPDEPLEILHSILSTLIDTNAESDEAASARTGLLLLFRWLSRAWIIKSLFPLLKEVFYDNNIIESKLSLEEVKSLLASSLNRSSWENEEKNQFLESLKSFPVIKS